MSVFLILAPIYSYADEPSQFATISSVSPKELSDEIGSRLMRVREFDFIRNEAERLGVKTYLFGGTAAGYAHYVKWDLLREKGDPRYQPNRFDYDYTNIYRSTQDLDIVIDGNAEQAQKLQAALADKFPHLQGSKSAWEVRLLTQDMGDKQAILDNPDFMNQHTDSNSTGLIEITKPAHGEAVVKDVRDWNSKEPYFLRDVHDGTLHYYFSPLHETTKFAKEGRNPPILSAIRYLTKAFQYELKLRPEDLARIKKVIGEFDPKRDTENSYVANWIEKNGKKLIQNAVNIEYAWDTLEKLGLRQKLASIEANPHVYDSLAWWVNKEPLRTKPVGQGTGKTARELGLDVVAHETRSYLALESITRAHSGDPNVLISRDGAPNEQAAHGNGFYVRIGKEGAWGTGLTVRFHLKPDAREGEDFVREADGDFIVVKNKAALSVIPESLNISPVEYMELVLADKVGSQSDLGIRERLERKMINMQNALSDSERKALLKMVQDESTKPRPSNTFMVTFRKLFPNLLSKMDPKILDHLHNLALDYVRKPGEYSNKLPPGTGTWLMHFLPKDSADEVIRAFLKRDKGDGYLELHPEFKDYLSELSPNQLEVAYKKLLPEILATKTPDNAFFSAGSPFHRDLVKKIVELNPDLIRPLLRHTAYPEVRSEAHAVAEDWERKHKRRIPWLPSEKLEALKTEVDSLTGDDSLKRYAIVYFTDLPDSTPEVDVIVYNELKSGNIVDTVPYFINHGPKHPDTEQIIYHYLVKYFEKSEKQSTDSAHFKRHRVPIFSRYFEKYPLKDKQLVEDLLNRLNSNSNFREYFEKLAVSAVGSNPKTLCITRSLEESLK